MNVKLSSTLTEVRLKHLRVMAIYTVIYLVLMLFVGKIYPSEFLGQVTLARPIEHYKSFFRGQPDPPPKNETARMARYIVHYSDWCALAHISHHGNTTGFPAARVYSTADGFQDTSSGTPYFYVSKMDAHINDLSTDGRCSVTMSLAEGEYCRAQSLDPEDPRCAQVILTGQFIFMDPDKAETQNAKSFLFQRHPVMSSWPEGHKWRVGKLKIGNVQVADNFGGSAYPSLQQYFDASPF